VDPSRSSKNNSLIALFWLLSVVLSTGSLSRGFRFSLVVMGNVLHIGGYHFVVYVHGETFITLFLSTCDALFWSSCVRTEPETVYRITVCCRPLTFEWTFVRRRFVADFKITHFNKFYPFLCAFHHPFFISMLAHI
jgi:hypothetical protein